MMLAVVVSLVGACKPDPLPPIDEKQASGMEKIVRDLDTMKADPGVRATIAAGVLSEAERGRLPEGMLKALDGARGRGIEADQKTTILFSNVDDELWKKACKDAKVREELGPAVPVGEKAEKTYTRCDFARFQLVTREDALAADPGALAMAFTVYDHLERHASLGAAEKTLLATLVRDSAGWR